jgi:hypothetical protein
MDLERNVKMQKRTPEKEEPQVQSKRMHGFAVARLPVSRWAQNAQHSGCRAVSVAHHFCQME